jgi:type VI secretion system secreted protein Hcp
MLSGVVLTLLLGVVLIPGHSARAAANAPAATTLEIFATIDTITGDSTAKGFEKQIEVQSFSFAGMNSAPTGAGKSIASPITFTAAAGTDSPLLLKALAQHTVLKTAVFKFVHTGGESPFVFQTYSLSNCLIVGFHQTAPVNGVVDEVQLAFAKVTYTVTQQKPDGSPGTTTTVTWDIKANKVS